MDRVLTRPGWLATFLAIALDRAWRDLRLLYVLPLWVPYSVLMSAVTVRALWLEARGARGLGQAGADGRADRARGRGLSPAAYGPMLLVASVSMGTASGERSAT